MNNSHLLEIASSFLIDGKPTETRPLGSGLINDTFLVVCDQPEPDKMAARYVLQRINTSIFRDPALLQANLKLITDHIRKQLLEKGERDIDRKVLSPVDTKDGESFLNDDGECWRMTRFIDNSLTLSKISPTLAKTTGKAFGQFHSFFSSDSTPVLRETIPDFHNVPFRIQQLKDAIEEDKVGRAAGVKNLTDNLLSREEEMTLAEKLYSEGKLPKRISHCDTKVDNILFDTKGEILCVIDLDTTMPGFIMSDFGDFIRTAANKGKEDDENIENVEINMEIFRNFAEGYVNEADFLLPIELRTLAHGAKRLTYMQAVRFLTDYINGDTYYKIKYPEHNLVRTKAQMKLLSSIDNNFADMEKFIEDLSQNLN